MQMKQLQMSGNQKRGGASDDDSDAEADEVSEQINAVFHEFAAVRKLVAKLFSFVNKSIFEKDKAARVLLGAYPQLVELIHVTLLQTENYLIRAQTATELKGLISACSGDPSLAPTLRTLLEALLLKVVPAAHEQPRRCATAFGAAVKVLECVSVEDLAPVESELWNLAQSLAKQVKTIDAAETGSQKDDSLLVGTLQLLRALMQKYPAKKAEVGGRLVRFLLHECLFEVPQSKGAGKIAAKAATSPKCKSTAARTAALQLIAVLSRDCLANLQVVLDYIRDFEKRASWRTHKDSDWAITHLDDEKSSTGYVGLKNLGCICYMISLFQQLFMIPGFR